MLRYFACLMGRHKPDLHRAWDDGCNPRARCAGCHKPMLQDHIDWRLFGPRDHNAHRRPHPRSTRH